MFPVIFTSILTPVVLFRKLTKLNGIHILHFLNMQNQEEDLYVTQLLYFLFLMVIGKDIMTLFWITPSIKKPQGELSFTLRFKISTHLFTIWLIVLLFHVFVNKINL